jgi:DNA-binding CsgD family transcriptional regulator
MIEYINKRMIDWATWRKRSADGGLGYPGAANFCQIVSHGNSESGAIIGAAEMEIDRIVSRLKMERPLQYEVARWVYLAGDLTMARVAEKLHCNRDTVYTRLHALHLRVMDELNEITIQAGERCVKNLFSKYA